MTNKKKSEITREFEFLKVDGRYFEIKNNKERVSYVEVPKKKVEQRIKLLKEVTSKMKDSLDKEAVLMEALSKLPYLELKQFYNALFRKKIKPKTRKHHSLQTSF